MVDSTIEDLTELTDPAGTDLTVAVDDPSGTPLTKKLTIDNLLALYDTRIATLTNKTLTTPTIASFTNATHDHTDAAGGGNIAAGGYAALSIALADIAIAAKTEAIMVAASDETTALATGTAVTTFRMPYAFTLTEVRASLTTAGTGAALVTIDINETGTSILSTKITIDATETTSTTATTPPVISDTTLADDAEMTIDIDQIDTGGVSAGLKIYLIGYQT